jgi:antitoxin (DNA-binding transcriptional repressor) of toxin-antitoxin stability system
MLDVATPSEFREPVMSQFVIDVHELPGRFAEAISQATAGADVIVTEGSVPRARIVPIPAAKERRPGLHPGALQMSDDFDAPLQDDFWASA